MPRPYAKGWRWCPFTAEEIRQCRTLLKLSVLEMAQALNTWPKTVQLWEQGKTLPRKALSLALVRLIAPVWYGDTQALDLEAYWALQRASRAKVNLEKKVKLGKKKISKKIWTLPLTGADDLLECPKIPKWTPGLPKKNS